MSSTVHFNELRDPLSTASSRSRTRRKKCLGFAISPPLAALFCLLVLGGVALAVVSSQKLRDSHPKAPAPSATPSATPSASPSASPTASVPSMTASPSATPSPTPSTSISANTSASYTPLPSPHPSVQPFLFWNGLKPAYDSDEYAWFDALDVNANVSFTTLTSAASPDDVAAAEAAAAAWRHLRVQVDWADHNAVQLFADPEFLQRFDDIVRAWNHNAANYSGSIDECGWPADPFGLGFSRRRDCFHEDFADGWRSSSIRVALAKSCCSSVPVLFPNYTWWPGDPHSANPPLDYSGNIGVEEQMVEYPAGVFRRKNVLRLTAINSDDPSPEACGGCADPSDPKSCPNCHKSVLSSGLVETADLFASGKYEVVANVPAASGMVWAMWTFHYEEHLPYSDCSKFGCFKQHYHGVNPLTFPNTTWPDCCGKGCCEAKNRPAYCPALDSVQCECCTGISPCADPTLCNSAWGPGEKQCMADHDKPDPQFTANASINSWKVQVNHEIDIEIPANCEGTSVCGATASPFANFTQRKLEKPGCIGRFNTANLNNYIFTTPGGTGPAYSNMCVAVHDEATGKPEPLVGGNKYRKYTIDWHTGGVLQPDGSKSKPRVDFYVDDVYLGTNNVFVPSRASRLTFGMWAGTGHYSWNNWPDDWAGHPGDGQFYMTHAYVSEVRVQPYNEPNDIVYPASYDQPDGCSPFYLASGECHRLWKETDARPPALADPQPGVLQCAADRIP